MAFARLRLRSAGFVAPVSVLCGLAAVVVACGSSDGGSAFVDPNANGEAGASSSSGFLDSAEAGTGKPGDPGAVSACGNGVKNAATEICDDGNTKDGDGCNSKCRVEPGWLCVTPGVPCVAIKCGDKILAGQEDCDDGNTKDGDGCSATCRVEEGFKCPPPGTSCSATTCGDGKKEGVEQCDDGNLDPFDGCDPECHAEPQCSGGTCTSVCGDGLRFSSEGCDDGNSHNGDGCSSTCKVEPGFSCTDALEAPTTTRDFFVAYRDFKARASVGGHPDFLNLTIDQNNLPTFNDPAIDHIATGLVQNTLDAAGKPQFLSRHGSGTLDIIEDATSFSSWYRDTALSKKFVSKLTLTRNPADGSYAFDSTAFFPLDGIPTVWPETEADNSNVQRNFLFTSELRIPFKYRGGENLTFRGDDDVWVFVNGKLAVDLGGVKNANTGSVLLDSAKATELGLTIGGMYEFVVFQAERNPTASNYRVSLVDFDRIITTCKSVCGDGIKTADEVCDDGKAKNTGGYGKCNADCSRGPFCGDGILQADQGEQCDSTAGCSADCRLAQNAPK